MSWGKFFMMPDFGSDDYHRRLRESLQSSSLREKAADLDARLGLLSRENRELKLYVAGLLQMLVRKGTFEQREIEELVRLVDRAEQEARQSDAEPTSPDLEAIAAAARRRGTG